MASSETRRLQEQIDQLVVQMRITHERDKQLSREVEKHLQTLRRLAGSA